MNQLASKKIWIDLDNSPHVPFFHPIMKELSKRGYEVVLTARNCFQTCGLADLFELEYLRVGRHYGRNKALKVIGTLFRAAQLLPVALKERPALSVSHGSRSQLIASVILRVPAMSIFDYEYTAKLGPISPNWVMAPELIPESHVAEDRNKLLRYPGIKEDAYVPEFSPDRKILSELGLNEDHLVVTIRPPATEAHYHNPESEKLFAAVINSLGPRPDVCMVMLPRNKEKQTELIRQNWPEWCASGKIIFPEHVVNGLDLMWFSDLVISGGGTMNREAAALGVPVYSIFRGKIGSVDHYLSGEGRLTLLKSIDDVQKKLKVVRRNKSKVKVSRNKGTLNAIVNNIIKIVESI